MSSVYAQLQEAENKRQQAIAAEQQRIAAENAARQQIAEADAQIARLRQVANAETFQRAIVENAELVERNRAAIAAALPALDAIVPQIAEALRQRIPAIDATFQQQQAHVNSAANMAVGSTDLSAARAEPNGNALGRQIAGAAGRAYKQLGDNGLPSWAALAQYIADAPDDTTRRIRAGIVYALTGHLFNPTPNYSAKKEVENQLNNDRRPLY